MLQGVLKNILKYFSALFFFLCLLCFFSNRQRAFPPFSFPAARPGPFGPLPPRSPAGLASEAVQREASQPSIQIDRPGHLAFPHHRQAPLTLERSVDVNGSQRGQR